MAIYRDTVDIVFKTSNSSNDRHKLKLLKNKPPDELLGKKKIPGIPDNAVILEVGFGETLVQSYIKKYKL